MLQIAIEAALEAGKYLKENVGKIRRIEHKGGHETNLVTEIDQNAEAMIIGRIKKHFPDHDFWEKSRDLLKLNPSTDG